MTSDLLASGWAAGAAVGSALGGWWAVRTAHQYGVDEGKAAYAEVETAGGSDEEPDG